MKRAVVGLEDGRRGKGCGWLWKLAFPLESPEETHLTDLDSFRLLTFLTVRINLWCCKPLNLWYFVIAIIKN